LHEVSAFHEVQLAGQTGLARAQPAGLEHNRMIFCRPAPSASLAGRTDCLKNAPMQSPSSLVDVHILAVPAGVIHTPLEPDHIVDIHLGEPVRVSCRLDGPTQRGLQVHGVMSVVPAGVTGVWDMARPADALLMRLAPSMLADAANSLDLSGARSELVPTLLVNDPHIVHLGHVLKAERDTGYSGGRLFAESIGAAVAARLLCRQNNLQRETTIPGGELPKWRLRTVREYIDANLDSDLSLAELARIAGFSVSHFKPLFKRAVGVPVHRYVVEQRVERARILLLQGGRSMADIALEAGFTHQSHMARWVRRVLGISPAEVALYRH
jgi:AraC family transcriptional regulator